MSEIFEENAIKIEYIFNCITLGQLIKCIMGIILIKLYCKYIIELLLFIRNFFLINIYMIYYLLII